MKKQDISTKKNIIHKAICDGQLAIAFKFLREFSELLMTWELTDEISRLEESYRYMLDYAMRGIADPSRSIVYNDITERMRILIDKLERHALTNDSPTLYYNTLRYIKHSDSKSIAAMLAEYSALVNDYWTTGAHMSPSCPESIENRRKREVIEKDIFNRVWTAMPLDNEDYEALSNVYKNDHYYSYFKQLTISALLLGMLEYYDSKRILLMLDAYDTNDRVISSVAVVALLLSLYTYRDRPIDEKAKARLKLLSDNPKWHDDIRNAFLELVRTRDTERITQTMQNEVVPEMIKLHPEIKKHFDGFNNPAADLNDLDINPEWQEMLEKSGIADKMKKLFEIQLEGGDVFMSTFAHLKTFPFFNDISNWFIPFHAEHSAIVGLPDELSDIVGILESSPVFCNGDKYSFVLSLQNIPASQRELLKSQINSQVDGLIEMQKSSLDNDAKSQTQIMNRYVQDLYRFFKLFRRKGEFHDPFITDLNLVTIPCISAEFNDIESLQAIAEFYFKHKYYSDALNIFKIIEQISCPDIQLFEKMGYCYERQQDFNSALRFYEQAELLNADSLWTLRHIALSHRMLGNTAQALSYYKRLLEKDVSTSTLLSIGNCYLELEKYEKALKYFYKVNYLDESNTKVRRQLAWTLMMMREFEKAKEQYALIPDNSFSADDFMNSGHLSLAMHDGNNALNLYKSCISRGNLSIDEFAEKLKSDTRAFKQMGLDAEIIPLIIDAIRYSER